jgi:hypothetical protein
MSSMFFEIKSPQCLFTISLIFSDYFKSYFKLGYKSGFLRRKKEENGEEKGGPLSKDLDYII